VFDKSLAFRGKPSCNMNYAHPNNNKNFQYICSIKGRENFPTKMHFNDISATSDLDKAQLFNDYFHSVFSTSTGTPLNVLKIQSSDHMLHINDVQFSDTDFLDLLTSLDTSKACGIDSLSPRVNFVLFHCFK